MNECMKKIEAACQILVGLSVDLHTECIPLMEAYDRVLAEKIMAKYAVPSFPKSAYDGYALRRADIQNAGNHHPVTLKVTETIPAGSTAQYPVTEGMAARIMTGAMIPAGADAVVKHEDTSFTETEVTCYAPAGAANIVEPGEDVRQGECLGEPGKVLGAAQAAALAGQGRETVCVYKRPEIAIFSTGSELLSPGQGLAEGRIYNTNPYLLSGYIHKYGMVPKDCGIVEDDVEKMADKIGEAVERYDMVITTGGVSAGDFDFIPEVMAHIGADVLFHRLPFKPGGAMLAAEKDGKVILGLSGNPGAAAVGMLRIGLPYMKKLCGRSDWEFTEATAVLEEPYTRHGKGTGYLRGRAHIKNGRIIFRRNENQRNGAVSSMMDCSLLGEIPPESHEIPAGAEIKVYFM